MRVRPALRHVLLATLAAAPIVPALACGGALVDEAAGSDDDAGTTGYLGRRDAAREDEDGDIDTLDDGDVPHDASTKDVSVKDASVKDVSVSDASVSDAAKCEADAEVPDSGGFCYSYAPMPCGLDASAGIDYATCQAICGDANAFFCGTTVIDGNAWVTCNYCAIGRRPEDFDPLPAPAAGVGPFFAAVASLEAASVPAFRRLRDELAAHGAPSRLVRRAARSAREEIRHARATRALARRRGGCPSGAGAELSTHRTRSARSLEDVARENAIEGCVRETYGALTAAWQAARACDPEVRAVMRRVADEETSHAELSWAIARWARTRLSREARARVDAAAREAAETLAGEIARGRTPSALVEDAGMPTREEALRLFEGMRAALAI